MRPFYLGRMENRACEQGNGLIFKDSVSVGEVYSSSEPPAWIVETPWIQWVGESSGYIRTTALESSRIV